MRKRTPSPIHAHRKAKFHIIQISPFRNYMEEELSMVDVSEKLIDCSGEQFFNFFKQHNSNFFKYGTFKDVYFYNSGFSSMFLLFNDAFYLTYKKGYYYALSSSLSGLSTFLIKEHYPNETEYLNTVAYLDGVMNFKEGSLLIEFM